MPIGEEPIAEQYHCDFKLDFGRAGLSAWGEHVTNSSSFVLVDHGKLTLSLARPKKCRSSLARWTRHPFARFMPCEDGAQTSLSKIWTL